MGHVLWVVSGAGGSPCVRRTGLPQPLEAIDTEGRRLPKGGERFTKVAGRSTQVEIDVMDAAFPGCFLIGIEALLDVRLSVRDLGPCLLYTSPSPRDVP